MSKRRAIAKHYEWRISRERVNYRVLDWANAESQQVRFAVLADNVPLANKRLLDVGCGLGDLLGFLRGRGITVDYTGVDILAKMAEAAAELQREGHFLCGDIFTEDMFAAESFEVVFGSGIFNLNLGNNLEFLPQAIGRMLALTSEYLVFNLLHQRMAIEGHRYFFYDPVETERMLRPLGCKVNIIDDYLANDFTVICRK